MIAIALLYFNFFTSLYVEAFLIGVFPIWAEVIASTITKVEPAREKRKSLLYIDAIIDMLVFILVPAAWCYTVLKPSAYEATHIAIFIIFGASRLVNFVKNGLSKEGTFSGLPVTYTGYIWLVVVLLAELQFHYFSYLIIALAGFAMVFKKIQIHPSR
ncbi:MAG: hypothetical protein KDD37_08905 [Bdellovibrionales bacterium]|nr:hypothetical protein [Bdellovibrionales bacterium]